MKIKVFGPYLKRFSVIFGSYYQADACFSNKFGFSWVFGAVKTLWLTAVLATESAGVGPWYCSTTSGSKWCNGAICQ